MEVGGPEFRIIRKNGEFSESLQSQNLDIPKIRWNMFAPAKHQRNRFQALPLVTDRKAALNSFPLHRE
jgi:hypothetical protein